MQITADGSVARYGPDLDRFVSGLRSPRLREQALLLSTQARTARRRLFSTAFAAQADLDSLDSSARALRDLIRMKRPDFELVWSALQTTFMDRTVENMRIDAMQRFEAAHSPPTTSERENRRDAINGDNLRWLIDSKYGGRKVVVWAHNVHVMKAYLAPNFLDVHLQRKPGDMQPMGVFMAEWLGKQLYTIGVTAFEGSEGMAVTDVQALIPPAPEHSLEANLHTLGFQYAFVKLQTCPQFVVRMPKFASARVSHPGSVYDGLFFIDHMKPATRIAQ
jgi:erythromycin esterase-like protein